MSIAWQADVFCDGEEVNGDSVGCDWFVEQGVVQHDSTRCLASGAWESARIRGWQRVLPPSIVGYKHLCANCHEKYRSSVS